MYEADGQATSNGYSNSTNSSGFYSSVQYNSQVQVQHQEAYPVYYQQQYPIQPYYPQAQQQQFYVQQQQQVWSTVPSNNIQQPYIQQYPQQQSQYQYTYQHQQQTYQTQTPSSECVQQNQPLANLSRFVNQSPPAESQASSQSVVCNNIAPTPPSVSNTTNPGIPISDISPVPGCSSTKMIHLKSMTGAGQSGGGGARTKGKLRKLLKMQEDEAKAKMNAAVAEASKRKPKKKNVKVNPKGEKISEAKSDTGSIEDTIKNVISAAKSEPMAAAATSKTPLPKVKAQAQSKSSEVKRTKAKGSKLNKPQTTTTPTLVEIDKVKLVRGNADDDLDGGRKRSTARVASEKSEFEQAEEGARTKAKQRKLNQKQELHTDINVAEIEKGKSKKKKTNATGELVSKTEPSSIEDTIKNVISAAKFEPILSSSISNKLLDVKPVVVKAKAVSRPRPSVEKVKQDVKPVVVKAKTVSRPRLSEEKVKQPKSKGNKSQSGPTLRVDVDKVKFYRGNTEEDLDEGYKRSAVRERPRIVFDETVAWRCAFCNFREHSFGLGDLFGPYYVDRMTNDKACKKETWLHSGCSLWSPGVVLVGSTLCGLTEAVIHSETTQCTVCQKKGATIACFARGCDGVVHLPCAMMNKWTLDSDNFQSHCSKHCRNSNRAARAAVPIA